LISVTTREIAAGMEVGGQRSTPVYQDGASISYYRFNGLPPGSRQEYWTHNVQGRWTGYGRCL
jgi:hypothetical protein